MNLLGASVIPADDIADRTISIALEAPVAAETRIESPAPVSVFQTWVPATEPTADQAVLERPEADAEDQLFEEIRQILETIPAGRATLKVIEDYQISVGFEAGHGSYFEYWANHINVDGSADSPAAALLLVHEATHAMYYNEGQTADLHTLTREEYIQAMAEEEAEAEVKVEEAKIELESTDIDLSEASPLFEMDFRKAYGKAVRWEWMTNRRHSTQDERNAVGRQAGKEEIIRGFLNGKVIGSAFGVPYPVAWGSHWDATRAHTKAALEAGLYPNASPDLPTGDGADWEAGKNRLIDCFTPGETTASNGDLQYPEMYDAERDAMKSATESKVNKAKDALDPQVDHEPANLVACDLIRSAPARKGSSPLVEGLLQLVNSVLSWGRRVPLRGRSTEGLECPYRTYADCEAVEVARKNVLRGALIQIGKPAPKDNHTRRCPSVSPR